MALINIANVGQIGLIKDLSVHELPDNAWTDAHNIRFLDGYAHLAYGYSEIYQTPSVAPQHVFPINVAGVPYWIYLSAAKAYAVTSASGVATHTDLTHATPLTGLANQWTSTLLSGIPVINAGNVTDVPAAWDLNLANNFVNLSNWPVSTYCKSMRAFKNFLIALNVTKTATNYPFMVKWSDIAVPGALPSSWDITDATKKAGETDLAEGYDAVVDGLQMRDVFIIYKENSAWLMAFSGGTSVFSFRKLFEHGIMARNCAVEYDGLHFVVTRQDVILHDGNTAQSVLDKQTRRYLFDDIDGNGIDLVFVTKNPYFNEILVCYPSSGNTVCNKAMIWNYKDRTTSFRDLPNINHANFGGVNNNLSGQWDQDVDTWDSDISTWQKDDFVPIRASVVMASNDINLYLLDGASTQGGSIPNAILERRGLSLGAPEAMKTVRGIRPRITGTLGGTVSVSIGASDDPYADPTYTDMTHTIGSTIANDCLVSGRYIAVKFEEGNAVQWRLDSYQLDVQPAGAW